MRSMWLVGMFFALCGGSALASEARSAIEREQTFLEKVFHFSQRSDSTPAEARALLAEAGDDEDNFDDVLGALAGKVTSGGFYFIPLVQKLQQGEHAVDVYNAFANALELDSDDEFGEKELAEQLKLATIKRVQQRWRSDFRKKMKDTLYIQRVARGWKARAEPKERALALVDVNALDGEERAHQVGNFASNNTTPAQSDQGDSSGADIGNLTSDIDTNDREGDSGAETDCSSRSNRPPTPDPTVTSFVSNAIGASLTAISLVVCAVLGRAVYQRADKQQLKAVAVRRIKSRSVCVSYTDDMRAEDQLELEDLEAQLKRIDKRIDTCKVILLFCAAGGAAYWAWG